MIENHINYTKILRPFLLRPVSLAARYKKAVEDQKHENNNDQSMNQNDSNYTYHHPHTASTKEIQSPSPRNPEKDGSMMKITPFIRGSANLNKKRTKSKSYSKNEIVEPRAPPNISNYSMNQSNFESTRISNSITPALQSTLSTTLVSSPYVQNKRIAPMPEPKSYMKYSGYKEHPVVPKIVLETMNKHFYGEKKKTDDYELGSVCINSATLNTKIQDNLINRIYNTDMLRDPIMRSNVFKSCDSRYDPVQSLPVIDTKKKAKPKVTAKSWAICDAYTSKILCEKNSEDSREIASLTKVMTCLVSLLLADKLKMDMKKTYITVSKMAASMIGTTANLKPGDQLSIWDLLHGLMLPSGNDAAYCLAEKFGNYLYFESEEFKLRMNRNPDSVTSKVKNPVRYFIREMNRTAKTIGMVNTHYVNPHGLCNKFNTSTARDIGILCCVCMKNDIFKHIVAVSNYAGCVRDSPIGPRTIMWENTNKLLSKGYDGIKTGITNNAGPCLAASIKQSGYHLVIVILGSKSMEKRWNEVPRLCEWALKKLEKLHIIKEDATPVNRSMVQSQSSLPQSNDISLNQIQSQPILQ